MYSVFGLILHFLLIADLPTSPETTRATFTDDTAVLAFDTNPAIASSKLTHLLVIQNWLTKLGVKVNESKSTYVTFTARRDIAPGIRRWTTPHQDIVIITTLAYRM
jgi:hypothetical protein